MEILSENPDLLKEMVRTAIQEFLKMKTTETVGAKKGGGTELRFRYRAGYYPRRLVTRAEKTELIIPGVRPALNPLVIH